MDSSSDVKNYAWLSSVNLSNFVTINPCLEGDERSDDFNDWKEQMLCLLESQDVLGFVNGEILKGGGDSDEEQKQWRRIDRLIKGWILGSIGKDAVDAVREKPTAREVWLELDNIFKQPEKNQTPAPREDFSRYMALYHAVQRGEWEFAENFFADINELATTIISPMSETALHVAVMVGKSNINLVKKLVELTPRDALAVTKNMYGNTALHCAAIVGNTEAAVALIDKNSDLLYTLNNRKLLPVIQAAIGGNQKETLKYLISKCDPNVEINNPFQGQLGTLLLTQTIYSGLLDIAMDLAQKYPNLALLRKDGDSALSVISQMQILFPRTESFTWWQKFIYYRIPIKRSKCGAAHNTSAAGDIQNYTSFHILSPGKFINSHYTIYVQDNRLFTSLIKF